MTKLICQRELLFYVFTKSRDVQDSDFEGFACVMVLFLRFCVEGFFDGLQSLKSRESSKFFLHHEICPSDLLNHKQQILTEEIACSIK